MKKFIVFCFFLLALPAWARQPGTVALAASARPEAYWSFWLGENAAGYRQKMLAVVHALLLTTGADTRVIELADPSVPDQLNRDRAPWPRHQVVCRDTRADVLLSLRVEDPLPVLSPWQADLFSNRGDVPSAHWPNLYLIAHDCSSGNRLSEHLALSPRAQDQFVFETDLLAYTGAFWDKALTRFALKLD
ncbi:MAG TPA: hypothetical protein VEP67_02075 [Thiobacillaceae bacterium]|nr:hypothetical protein [Thiobacillaceae bacterium]